MARADLAPNPTKESRQAVNNLVARWATLWKPEWSRQGGKVSHELGFLPSIPTTIFQITMKEPGNDLAEVSWRMVKLVVSHPGGPAPQPELSTSPCQTQSRRQARGPVTPELPFFACTGPPYGCENRQGHQLRAHLPAPDLDPSAWWSSWAQLGWKTIELSIQAEQASLCWPHQAVLCLFSSHLLLPHLFPLHTFPFPQSLTNSGYIPALCQAQAEPWKHRGESLLPVMSPQELRVQPGKQIHPTTDASASCSSTFGEFSSPVFFFIWFFPQSAGRGCFYSWLSPTGASAKVSWLDSLNLFCLLQFTTHIAARTNVILPVNTST